MNANKFACCTAVFSFVVVVCALVAGACSPETAPPLSTWKMTILHINDPHGHYAAAPALSDPNIVGGFARIAHVIKETRAENKSRGIPTLVLMGGDLLTGTVFSTVWRGAMGAELMNKIGFDAMVVGNHEFDYGAEHLTKLLKPQMAFPLISANIINSTGTRLFHAIVEKTPPFAPNRIVIIGLTTPQTSSVTHPRHVGGLTFTDPVETARAVLEKYVDADLVIGLTHLGVEEDRRLAAALPKLDVIVGGHSHTALFEPIRVGDALIAQAGAYSIYVGRLDLTVSKGKIVDVAAKLIPMTKSIPEDTQIRGAVSHFKGKLDDRLNEVVGTTEVRLEGTRSAVRSGKTVPLGRLIGVSMASEAQTQAAVVNGGAIRDGFEKGDITLSQVLTVLPFEDQVVKLGISGRDLLSVLERSESLPPGDGGKLQTYGILFRSSEGRMVVERVGDKPFSPDEIYYIATNDFLAAGGDGYTVLRDAPTDRFESSVNLSATLLNTLQRHRVITEPLLESLEK